ncbi:MAG: carbon monoxide dehydrogenase subunit G [Chloroflexota bacterium]|nr:MAG: carbon monoxide dehydrogenase subunit G [Chloroflexota bacterium]
MKIEGEYTFDGPREAVWEIMRDPEVLASALPGTQSLDQVSENEYQGEMQVRIGPVAGLFSGNVAITDEVPPESLTMTVEGRGKPGFVKGTGAVQLIAQESDKTLMQYEGDLQVGGRLASVGQRMMDSVSKSLLKQGLDSINNALLARQEAQSTGEKVEYQAPSESEFAASVAKDMAGDVLTSRRMLWIAGAIIVIVILLAIYLMSRG